jgi:hypothetical protein
LLAVARVFRLDAPGAGARQESEELVSLRVGQLLTRDEGADRPLPGGALQARECVGMNNVDMTPRDRTERWQRLGRAVLEQVDALRLSDDLDECFYEAVREALVTAGATDTEIDGMAALFITWATEQTAPGSDERESQYDLITTHLARTTVRISANKAKSTCASARNPSCLSSNIQSG